MRDECKSKICTKADGMACRVFKGKKYLAVDEDGICKAFTTDADWEFKLARDSVVYAVNHPSEPPEIRRGCGKRKVASPFAIFASEEMAGIA